MLAGELLEDALTKARNSAPVISVTARLHIARVIASYSREEARALLLEAVRELETLELRQHDLHAIRREARMLGAATAPDLTADFPSLSESTMIHSEFQFFRTMLDHGHAEAAFGILMKFEPASRFPHMAVPMVMVHCTDGERKLALVRRAVQAWLDSQQPQDSPPSPRRLLNRFDFLNIFAGNWRMLPAEEALPIVRKLVAAALAGEDGAIHARFDPEQRVGFTSMKQHRLFELLDPVRHLDPALADSLIRDHPELAAAAAIFPFGMHSVIEAWTKKPVNQQPSNTPGFGMGGTNQDIRFFRLLMAARCTGQFDAAFEEALRIFHQDDESNGSAKECWPSTQAFRTLFHAVGTSMGPAGATYLDRVPDRDLRLYCQIEFAAGLAGLPNYSGMRVSSPLTATTAS